MDKLNNSNEIVLSECPGNLRVFACRHILEQISQVNLVVHHLDGDINILYGDVDHAQDAIDYPAVSLTHVLTTHPDLRELPPLQRGWDAEGNAVGESWQLARVSSDD